MPDLPRPHLLAYALALLAVLAFAFRQFGGGADTHASASAHAPIRLDQAGSGDRTTGGGGRTTGGARLDIVMAGAVHRPGVYRPADGARVNDAVRRAGAATRRADLA